MLESGFGDAWCIWLCDGVGRSSMWLGVLDLDRQGWISLMGLGVVMACGTILLARALRRWSRKGFGWT